MSAETVELHASSFRGMQAFITNEKLRACGGSSVGPGKSKVARRNHAGLVQEIRAPCAPTFDKRATHMSMCLVAASERRDAPLSTTSNSTACECRDELDERISVNVAAVEIGRNDVPSLEAPKVR